MAGTGRVGHGLAGQGEVWAARVMCVSGVFCLQSGDRCHCQVPCGSSCCDAGDILCQREVGLSEGNVCMASTHENPPIIVSAGVFIDIPLSGSLSVPVAQCLVN